MKPLVAIVGRPNVGKSTLFNRLARRESRSWRTSPASPGTGSTADVEMEGREFTLIDTGGFLPGEKDSLLQQVREQAQLAVEECDAIVFVTDARAGLTTADQEVAHYLRKSGKPVVVAANKLDSPSDTTQSHAAEFFRLGLGDVFAISAEHGLGVGTMMETVLAKLPPLTEEELAAKAKAEARAQAEQEAAEEGRELPPEEEDAVERPIRVAIIGRPNVGKSTLVNALLKKKRVVASEIPGTTRDPIDSELTYKERKLILTDTAGIRRKKTIAHRLEKFTVVAALKAMESSDVAVLLMDATEPAVDQDAKLAGIAEEKGRALVIVVNKWDLISADQRKQELFREELKYQLKFVHYAPIVFTSALTGSKVEKVLELAVELADQFRYRAPTPQLNRLLEHIVGQPPGRPSWGGARCGCTTWPRWARRRRPSRSRATSRTGVPDMYKRYITNQLRKTFDLRVPLRLLFRERPGKAKREARRKPRQAGRSIEPVRVDTAGARSVDCAPFDPRERCDPPWPRSPRR